MEVYEEWGAEKNQVNTNKHKMLGFKEGSVVEEERRVSKFRESVCKKLKRLIINKNWHSK